MSAGETSLLQLLESVVFDVVHDDILKTGVKASKSAEDIVTVSMATQVADIKKLFTEDAKKEEARAKEVSVSGKPVPSPSKSETKQAEEAEAIPFTKAMERVAEEIQTLTGRELTEEENRAISTYGMKSKRALWSTTKLLVYSSENRMAKALQDTIPGRRRGEPGKEYTGIILDSKMLGSPATAPNHRIIPLNPTVVKSMLRSWIKTRGTTELHPGDIYFILDGGMHSYRQKALNCFVDDDGTVLSKSEKLVYLLFDEESIRQRKGCVRGMNAFDQVEYMSMVNATSLDEMPSKTHKFFPGTNQGNKLGDLKIPRMDSLWKLEPTARKELYADPANLFWAEVGGPTPQPDGSKGPGRGAKKPAVTKEPVFWHPSEPNFYEELVHSYCLRDVYDMTAGDGTAALLFAKLKLPYVGLCLTQRHMDELTEWLEYKHFSASFSTEPTLAAMFPQITSTPSAAPKAAAKASASGAPMPNPPNPAPGTKPQGNQTASELMKSFQEKLKALAKKGADPADEVPDSQE